MTTPNLISKPAKGAIERDWTNATLVLDVTNAIGEQFHFEIEPTNTVGNLPSGYGNTGWGEKCQINMHFPILNTASD